jgi:heptaprenyl diphosphate synthase
MNRKIVEVQTEFLVLFEEEWHKTMNELRCTQKQLFVGSRLRPQILLWGYLTKMDLRNNFSLFEVVYMAVSVELVHKASLILDDWIDDDLARHGENAFHVDSGEHTAVMTAMLLVTESIKRLVKIQSFTKSNNNCLELLVKTAQSMTFGILEELSLNELTQFNYEINKRIALLETTEIISNSLLIGYSLNHQKDDKCGVLLGKIGELCGYMFQSLNDLESFCNSDKNKLHKGIVNYDYNKYRKNLALSRLYDLLSSKEKEALSNELDIHIITKYFKKYKIEKLIFRETELVFNEILELTSSTIKYGATTEWISGYTEFMYMLREVANRRLT